MRCLRHHPSLRSSRPLLRPILMRPRRSQPGHRPPVNQACPTHQRSSPLLRPHPSPETPPLRQEHQRQRPSRKLRRFRCSCRRPADLSRCRRSSVERRTRSRHDDGGCSFLDPLVQRRWRLPRVRYPIPAPRGRSAVRNPPFHCHRIVQGTGEPRIGVTRLDVVRASKSATLRPCLGTGGIRLDGAWRSR